MKPQREELAAHLAFQLERLQAMRDAAARLMARIKRTRLFLRGVPETVERVKKGEVYGNLIDLASLFENPHAR